jgi:hypothetical protein
MVHSIFSRNACSTASLSMLLALLVWFTLDSYPNYSCAQYDFVYSLDVVGYCKLFTSCYLSREDHNRKIRTRKQRTDIGKYFFVNRTIIN